MIQFKTLLRVSEILGPGVGRPLSSPDEFCTSSSNYGSEFRAAAPPARSRLTQPQTPAKLCDEAQSTCACTVDVFSRMLLYT